MRSPRWFLVVALVVGGAAGCDIPKFTADSTAKVLVRANPSLKMEGDYELAARALPATLKTVEGFWVVTPDNTTLIDLLTEGYCQYGTGFVEDEVEQAALRKDQEAVAYHQARATKMFIRCMNYAFKHLGKKWQEELFGSNEQVQTILAKAGKSHRTPLMWVGIAIASSINNNKDRPEMTGYLETAVAILNRVVEIDDKKGPPKDKVLAALPHIALGMTNTGLAPELGGDPKVADAHFQKAIALTDGKFLLAQVLRARWVAFRLKDRKMFHDGLVKVLETPASIWPEQRLGNEIAHRRALRYLKQEQELFP